VLGELELAEAHGGRRPAEVALGRGLVADPLVGAIVVVVGAEAVKQKLQVLEVRCGTLVGEPFLERAMEALELAERLRVGGRGVDQFDACLGQLALELDCDPEHATGEARMVVGEELAEKPVGGAR
jgi:hypothetical protein